MIRAAALLLALAVPATAQEAVATYGTGPTPLMFRSTTDIAVLGPTIQSFTEANPDITVTYEQWGSNALYKLTLDGCQTGGGTADAVLSSGVHQMVELVNMACARPYRSSLTETLSSERIWRNELWGITREPAVMLYNTDLVPPEEVPRTRFQLLDLMRQQNPRYQNRIATYDIEASGLGYLLAFSDSIEASTFGGLLEGFSRTDAIATCCSAEIIKGVAEGRYLLAYNVLGSYVSTQPNDKIGVILPEDYTLFLSRAFMIPKNAPNPIAASRLLDFLLSDAGKAQLFVSGLEWQRDEDESGLPASSERSIRLEPMLLVARDQQRRSLFITQWRLTFGAPRFLTP